MKQTVTIDGEIFEVPLEPHISAGMNCVYGLTEPDNGKVRYVGQTNSYIILRLAQHVAEAHACPQKNPLKSKWIIKLSKEGKMPGIKILLSPIDDEDIDEMEMKIIKALPDLLNMVYNPSNPRISRTGRESKFTDEDIKDLRQIHSMYGLSCSKAGREYGVCKTVISKVLLNKSFRHI